MTSTDTSHAQSEALTKREYLTRYLQTQVGRGNHYFKSKKISADIELSPKEIGQLMWRLAEETDELVIEKWGQSSSVTWRVDRP